VVAAAVTAVVAAAAAAIATAGDSLEGLGPPHPPKQAIHQT